MSTYDSVLRDLLRLVRAEQDGVVGAAIVDGTKEVLAVSSETDEGKFRHAERNAVDAFKREYGEIPPSAVVVTTLSPCKHDDPNRVGVSCTDLLLSCGISRVHTGYIDPWQVPIETYADEGLVVTTTDDTVCESTCEALFDYFPRVIEDGEQVDIPTFIERTVPDTL